MPNIDGGEVMTIEELSSYLKIPKSTLYKLAQEGKLPGQKIGKQWRFGKRAIDCWINDDQPGEKK
ncbi:MAG: helix-turn-helix domain-containing protein [Sedimenticola sp.]